MKLNELRIGNLIYPIHLDGYAEVIEIMVSGIGIQKLGDNTQKSLVLTENIHRLEPIELTGEWLIKLGFKFSNGNWFQIRCNGEFDYLNYNTKNEVVSLTYIKDEFILSAEIKYIHQLQNIYFALTNEELTFKNRS